MGLIATTLALMLASWAAPVSAHLGATAYIIVPADHVLAGESFDVVGADMGPSSNVTFRLVHEQTTTELQSITTNADGHFQVTLSVPQEFPDGYAQLFATASDGTETSTWLLVGVRTASTPAPPSATQWWSDPSVLVLLVLVIGAFGLVGYILLRRSASGLRPRGAAAVRAPATGPRRSQGKRTRR
jgi:hypothetical protein